MALTVQQQIFRFEVALGDVQFVELDECTHDFHRVEERDVVAKPGLTAEAVEELPAGDELEQHVELLAVLAYALDLVDEGVVQPAQQVLFGLDVFDLLEFDDFPFLHALQGHRDVALFGVLLFGQVDSAECSRS